MSGQWIDSSVGTWKIPSDGILYLEGDVDDDTVNYELRGNVLTIYVENSVVPFYSFQKRK